MDVLEKRTFADRVLKRHVLGKRVRIRGDFRQKREKRLHFRRKVQRSVDNGVVKRLDPEAIARRKQPRSIPERKGKHSTQMTQTVATPLRIRSQNRFRVGGCAEG